MDKVQKSILRTLTFFDIFGRPLTLEEIWLFLYQTKAGKLKVLIGLKKLLQKSLVFEGNNYYALKNRPKIIPAFIENQTLIRRRWQKVFWVLKFLRFMPFLKNISVINSLSFGTATKDSDIDILIVAEKNRLWTARAMVVAVLELLGQNKNKWYQAGKFCLGFAFDDSAMALEKLRIKDDIYLSFWLANLTPIFDKRVYGKLIEANSWILSDLPNWLPREMQAVKAKRSFWEKFLQGNLGGWIETRLKAIQIKRIWSDPQNKRTGASVVATEHMMKLHAFDKRLFYKTRWQQKIKNL